jgi:hypothetical protein
MSFSSVYATSVEAYGNPIITIQASGQSANPADLPLTAMEWTMTPAADGATGPSSTLDYLCSVNYDTLPPVAPFSWHWVEPQDINDESGVIAINRNIIARHILQQLVPQAKKNCIKTDFSCTAHWQGWATWYLWLHGDQDPESSTVTESGSNVISIRFTPEYESHTETDLATSATIQVLPHYTCDVTFEGKVITVVQHTAFRLYVKLDLIGKTVMVVDKYLTDEYTLSVDQEGQLQTTLTKTTPDDRSESADGLDWFTNLFSGDINSVMASLRGVSIAILQIRC